MAYVYTYTRLDKNEVFYVGIGSDSKYKRAKNKSLRTDYFKKIINKSEYRLNIVFDNLSWEKACEKEIELIALYGRKDLGKGTLINFTDGGEGTHGYDYPEELREIRRKARLGYKVKEETKEKIRKTLSKQIYCITDDILFDSLEEAVKYSGVPKTTFHRKLNSNKLINGKQYEYKS